MDQRLHIDHFIDHDEPAEALLAMASVLVRDGRKVPTDRIVQLRPLIAGQDAEPYRPDDLDELAVTVQRL